MLMNDTTNKLEYFSIIVNELRESYGIKYRKEKKNKNQQDKIQRRKIFNVSLHQLELTDVILANGSITQVPLFVSDACQRILENVTVEGLFRKAGSTSRQREMKINLEAGERLGNQHHVIDVANLLKLFFRVLPEPILPIGNIQEAILRSLLCGDNKVDALMMTCLLLPALSLNTLSFFMQFLKTVSLNANQNKMTIENLAIIFAPGIMPLSEIIGQRLNCHVKIIQMLIENSSKIGIIPQVIIERVQNAADQKNQKNHQDKSTQMTEAEKKKKKRRSGSLTRMFNGLRKIVGAKGSSESLDKTPELNAATPCLSSKTNKKRKGLEVGGFSAKKKKDIISMLPQNGGILPCTPCTKEPKKSRLSLGGKRNSKPNGGHHLPTINLPTMERRWSVVGAGWSKKKLHTTEEFQVPLGKPLSPVISLPSLIPTSSNADSNICFQQNSQTMHNLHTLEKDSLSQSNNTDDFVRISKSEYEAIKERVSAIESRISQEFSNVQASILVSPPLSSEVTMNGPEQVIDKYEKTLEETELMNEDASTTDQLAKRLSRNLKIRRSADHQVIRSPSARKIGTMRRRSRENVRLSRNQSWHLGNKKGSESGYSVTNLLGGNMPNSMDLSFYPKVNLKRGRPNTLQSGLPPHPNPFSTSPNTRKTGSVSAQNSSVQNDEQWTSADKFFESNEPILNTPTVSTTTAQIDMKNDNPQTPFFVTTANLGEMKTPMLPPRQVPTRKTPAPLVKSSALKLMPVARQAELMPTVLVNKALMTPLHDQQTGRASIARLRSQNAGMVAAKAKLFNGMETQSIIGLSALATDRGSSSGNTTETVPNQKKINPNIKRIYNNSRNNSRNNSPKKSTPRRKNNNKHGGTKALSGIQRRQKLRLNASPVKKSPIHLQKIINASSNNMVSKSPKKYIRSASSPTSTILANSTIFLNTPHIKRPLVMKSPRRILKTPGRENKRPSPLRATPIQLRNSPRIKLLQNNASTTP